jgi:hypothetical protein
MKIKAGYRTSEFWFTMVSFIFSGLFLLGIIGDYSQKEELIRDVSHGVESVILIGGQLFVLYRYVKGRNEIKKIVEEEELEKIKQSKPVTQRNKNDNSKRTNNSRSRKTNPTTKRETSRVKKDNPR